MTCKHAQEKLQPESLKWKHLYFANKTSCKSDTCIYRGETLPNGFTMIWIELQPLENITLKSLISVENFIKVFSDAIYQLGCFHSEGRSVFTACRHQLSSIKETPSARSFAHKTAALAGCWGFLFTTSSDYICFTSKSAHRQLHIQMENLSCTLRHYKVAQTSLNYRKSLVAEQRSDCK